MFRLDERLAADTERVGAFPLSLLLLSLDANYPWFLLVPQRAGISEIYQLSAAEQQQLARESDQLARALVAMFKPVKINIAALGNVVAQLHVHHVARYATDPAWPRPVWGAVPAVPYVPERRMEVIAGMAAELAGSTFVPNRPAGAVHGGGDDR